MTVVRTGSGALFTGTPVVELEHTTHESVNVDHGAVHIDADDTEHVIRIKHEEGDGVAVLAAVDKNDGNTTMYIDSAGDVFTPNVHFGGSFQGNLQTFSDATSQQNQTNSGRFGTIESAATALTVRVADNELDINANDTNITAHAQTLGAATATDDGATSNLVQRDQATGTSIDNLHVVASSTNYQPGVSNPFPPAGLFFTEGTCMESLDLLANGQLAYQPYTPGGTAITTRTFTFGRAVPEQGQTVAQADARRDTTRPSRASSSCARTSCPVCAWLAPRRPARARAGSPSPSAP